MPRIPPSKCLSPLKAHGLLRPIRTMPRASSPSRQKPRLITTLAVKYSNDKSSEAPLAAGVYEVLLHAAPVVRNRTAIDSKILQAKIDAQGVQHALHARLERYAIRLPRPEAYVSTPAGRMRAGTAYPPGPSTENDYAMSVSLRYRASTLAGF